MPTSPKGELPFARRLAEAAALAFLVTVAYTSTGEWSVPAGAPLVHVLDTRIPFVAESVWMYLPGYWTCFILTVWAVRDPRQFRAALLGLATLTALAIPFFVLWPIAAPRPHPPVDDTLTAALVRWLYRTDPVGNTFPSLHVANATYCAVVTTASSRRWGAVLWLLAAGVTVSVLTLKQHWAVDVPGGWALATVGAAAWHAGVVAPERLAALGRWRVAPPVLRLVRERTRRLDVWRDRDDRG